MSEPHICYPLPHAGASSPESGSPGRDAPEAGAVHERLLAWFAVHGRDLPWRRTRDPYAILVAEMMLQQTGVDRVLPKWVAWLDRFPTLSDLASASRADVIRMWSGLGYNSRAVRLQEIARQVVAQYDGTLPTTLEALLALKGIGPYTAGAVLCFAHEQDVAFVDTNVRRVLSRVFLGREAATASLTAADLQRVADRALPAGRAWAWHQALMDLGATTCVDRQPSCLVCPLQNLCRSAFQAGRMMRDGATPYKAARRETPWRGSSRYYRGRIVEALRGLAPGDRIDLQVLAARLEPDATADHIERLHTLIVRLAADGLVEVCEDEHGTHVSLPR